MHRILIVTPARSRFAEFAARLVERQRVQVVWADNGRSAIENATRQPPLAAVIDETLPDMPGLDLVRRLLPVNAMIQAAVVSALAPEAFHEAGEGLGIMAQLPQNPSGADADGFLERLGRLTAARF